MSYLCSFHIPKVGGTTFASHAQKSLGKGQFILHGPFSRVDRFMRNQAQIEELPDHETRAIRVVHGHGAGLALAEAIVGRTPEFMIILRHPYARFVSGFHHYNNERRNNGLATVSAETYFERRGRNFYARMMRRSFEPLISTGKELDLQTLMPVLRSVKYFLLTERLDSQLQQIAVRYGLNTGKIVAQRINKSKSAIAIDTSEFCKSNFVDEELYSAIATAAEQSNGSIENPFGYDPDPLKNYLDRIWSQQTAKSRLARAYDHLVSSSKKMFKLQSVHLKLMHGSTSHVVDKELLQERTTAAIVDWLPSLGRQEASAAHFWSGAMFMNERKLDAAEEYLRKAVDLNPKNDRALVVIARVLFARGKKAEAITFIDQAAAMRPERAITQKIRDSIVGLVKSPPI